MARRLAIGCLVAAWLTFLAVPAGAEQARRYSGRVERVELAEGLVVVDELGEKGRLLRHEFHVEPGTPIVSAGRLRPHAMRGTAAFAEVAVSLVDLLEGDFVVVESVDEDGRTVARRITIVESSGPGRRPP